jgi:hypothetical protein
MNGTGQLTFRREPTDRLEAVEERACIFAGDMGLCGTPEGGGGPGGSTAGDRRCNERCDGCMAASMRWMCVVPPLVVPGFCGRVSAGVGARGQVGGSAGKKFDSLGGPTYAIMHTQAGADATAVGGRIGRAGEQQAGSRATARADVGHEALGGRATGWMRADRLKMDEAVWRLRR